jgi:predicted component of type VI protein secretion system
MATYTSCPYCNCSPLGADQRRCPQCQTDLDDAVLANDLTAPRIRANEPNYVAAAPPRKATRKESLSNAGSEPECLPFRPVLRPPMAVVCIFDDGREGGEHVRVRGDKLTIGRTEGDVVIPHDGLISGKHAEIVRVAEDGQYHWYVRDLDSTNGTFVRIDEGPLRHGQELLLGSRRYRFDANPQGAAVGASTLPKATLAVASLSSSGWSSARPALVEVTPHGDGSRVELPTDRAVIGSDPNLCTAVLPDDPFVSPRHAQLHRDAGKRWIIKSLEARNGIWARTRSIEIVCSAQIQIGEQRIHVRIP